MKHRRKSDPMGALRTLLLLWTTQTYMENRAAERKSPNFAMKEADRIRKMQNGTFWKTVVKILIVIFILIVLFT